MLELSNEAIDRIGLLLVLFPIFSYVLILISQFRDLNAVCYRLQVLNTRTAFYLPFYAALIYISLVWPGTYIALQIPVTFYEGYSFYAFFAMIVQNLGGPQKCIQTMEMSGGEYACCGPCCPKEHSKFYKKTCFAVSQLVIARTIVSTLIAAVFYIHGEEGLGKPIMSLLGIVNVIFLFYGVIHMVLLCK